MFFLSVLLAALLDLSDRDDIEDDDDFGEDVGGDV